MTAVAMDTFKNVMIYNIDQLKFCLKFPLILSPFKRSEVVLWKGGKREEDTILG